ncbi:MAG TPA: phenylalanine--tRNA ligase subunit beta [Terriglobia bacterium]|nr:phenylalanine--tRNA ligase subunit beta [Terriglobia bacterium]
MKISLNWLKEFVEVPVAPRELTRDLTMLGVNVESSAEVGDDFVFEAEVTSNRPDCLSHLGVAREVATRYHKPLKHAEYSVKDLGDPASAEVSIGTADERLCPRYCGRVLRHVKVQPSPAWLVKRLEAVGQRPINNVADVTNYVLMELGHPLHAFDLTRIRGRKIMVRRARPGETLRTLDGVDRTLTSHDLVIADAERAVALAGVMGGEESEISAATSLVLLESAWFDPPSVRRTAKSQGLHTEASHRFERGADIAMAPVALNRAALMIAELAGGEILRGMTGVISDVEPRKDIVLRRSEVVRILGTEINWDDVRRTLKSLGFEAMNLGAEGWRVSLPTFRLDVSREVDLIEEIARHYGYDRLPARVRSAPLRIETDLRRKKELTLAAALRGLGYREIIPPSMVDPEENARFTDKPPVVLANPLSQDASALRSSAAPSMVRALRWNLDRGQSDLRFYEFGKIYTLGANEAPEESRVLSIGVTGRRRPPDWREGQDEREKMLDFFDLKGELETLFAEFELGGLQFEPGEDAFHEKGTAGRFTAGGKWLASLGRLREELGREYKLRQEIWLAEVDVARLLEAPLRAATFRPLSKYPTVERDLSLTVPESVTCARICSLLSASAQPLLRDFRPVDFQPVGKIAAGAYSILLRLTFQSEERTLTGNEINDATRQILDALAPLGIRVRGDASSSAVH